MAGDDATHAILHIGTIMAHPMNGFLSLLVVQITTPIPG